MYRVLVVDDEAHVTRLVQQRLRSEGFDVKTANNGLQALGLLESDWPFHAVVTDYNMPKMDGRQLCEAIRERFVGEPIKIFLVTARIDDPLRDWAEGLPSLTYIEKPVSLHGLVERLNEDKKSRPEFQDARNAD